jgi:hypothetical protein
VLIASLVAPALPAATFLGACSAQVALAGLVAGRRRLVKRISAAPGQHYALVFQPMKEDVVTSGGETNRWAA